MVRCPRARSPQPTRRRHPVERKGEALTGGLPSEASLSSWLLLNGSLVQRMRPKCRLSRRAVPAPCGCYGARSAGSGRSPRDGKGSKVLFGLAPDEADAPFGDGERQHDAEASWQGDDGPPAGTLYPVSIRRPTAKAAIRAVSWLRRVVRLWLRATIWLPRSEGPSACTARSMVKVLGAEVLDGRGLGSSVFGWRRCRTNGHESTVERARRVLAPAAACRSAGLLDNVALRLFRTPRPHGEQLGSGDDVRGVDPNARELRGSRRSSRGLIVG